jgi:hypothetical protein
MKSPEKRVIKILSDSISKSQDYAKRAYEQIILGVDPSKFDYSSYAHKHTTLFTQQVDIAHNAYKVAFGECFMPAGFLYHTIRFPNSWQPWGDIGAVVGNDPGFLIIEGSASIGSDLHVVAIHVKNRELYHTIRFPNSWQPWGNVSAIVQQNPPRWVL